MGTFNGNILPTATGLDLGSSIQEWDLFARNANIAGNISGNPVFTGSPTFGKLNSADNGTFVNTQMSFCFESAVNGADPTTLFHSSQGASNYATEAVTAAVSVPVGSTVYQSDAVGAYIVDNSGTTNCVALYGYAQANVANGKCWGANPAVQAAAGAINTTIQGIEVDVNIQTGATGATAHGVNVSMPIAHATPALSQGVSVNAGNADGVKWDYAFVTQRAAATNGLFLDSLASTASTASQPIVLRGHDGGNVAQDTTVQASNVGDLNLTPASGQNVVVTAGSLGFGTSNVPFVSPDGAGGLRLIPVAGHSTEFRNGTGGSTVASVDSTGLGTFNGGLNANNAGIAAAGALSGVTTAAVGTSLTVGSGTAITQVKKFFPNISPTSVTAASVEEQTFALSGLSTSDVIVVNPPAISNATGIAGARVSATDTLAIRFVNPTVGALAPTTGVYTVIAFRS